MQRYFIELTKQEMDETPDFQITGEDVHHSERHENECGRPDNLLFERRP